MSSTRCVRAIHASVCSRILLLSGIRNDFSPVVFSSGFPQTRLKPTVVAERSRCWKHRSLRKRFINSPPKTRLPRPHFSPSDPPLADPHFRMHRAPPIIHHPYAPYLPAEFRSSRKPVETRSANMTPLPCACPRGRRWSLSKQKLWGRYLFSTVIFSH